jgi:Na+-transporting methylmalonyl-CoA/oxaloacetate decarboxylase gamma subunit
MKGFESILIHNGWAIAAVGVAIIFTGLTFLAVTISQIHKVISILERKQTPKEKMATK